MTDESFTRVKHSKEAVEKSNEKVVGIRSGIRGQTLPPYEEPLPFDIHLSPSTKFPINALPADIKAFVLQIHKIVKAPLAMCAQCVLSAIALVAQSHANILLDGRRHPLSLFFLTVGESGERKSAVDKIVLFIIQEFEKKLHALYKEELRRYEETVVNNKDVPKKHKRTACVEVEKPKEPILLVSEPTFEGLVKAFMFGQSSIGLFSSEGGRFKGGHAMNKENKLKTIAGFSDLWGGEAISVSRAEIGNIKLYGKRLSMHLMIQPKVANDMLCDPILIDQGFLARCLISHPDSNMGNRPYTQDDIYITQEYKIYADKILNLLETRPNHIDELVLRDISLTDEAKALAIIFHDEIELGLCLNGPYREVSGFAAKCLEHACRLAGVIALYNNSLVEAINKETMVNAIALTRFYLAETARLIAPYEKIEDKKESEVFADAEKLYNWIVKSVEEKGRPITLRVMHRFGPNRFRDKVILQNLTRVLVDMDWLLAGVKADEWVLNKKK